MVPLSYCLIFCQYLLSFFSGTVKHILYCLRNLKRLICILLSRQESGCLYGFSSSRYYIIMLSWWPVETIDTTLSLSADLITIVSSFLNFESSFYSVLERLLVDFVSIFSRFKLFRTSILYFMEKFVSAALVL